MPIIYEGLDYFSKIFLEFMCQGDLMKKNTDKAWKFLESLSTKTMLWEHYDEIISLVPPTKSSGLSLESNIASEAKIATILQWLEALETNERASAQINQVFAPKMS